MLSTGPIESKESPMQSDQNSIHNSGRFPYGIISFLLFFAGGGLWLYTGSRVFLFATIPAIIFLIIAALAGILLLLKRFGPKGRQPTD
jgi:hypothetical protein